MIAEVVRIIGPNSHTINANRETSSVLRTVNALVSLRRMSSLSLFILGLGEQMLLSSLPQNPVLLSGGGDLK